MAYLVLVRHGITEYNAKGMWTGWDNPDLTEKGIEEAKASGKELSDIHFDVGFTSDLSRAKDTLKYMLEELNQKDLQIIESSEIKERNYGIYTKKNKWEIKEQIGEEEFLKLRRSWDYPIPEGESLKQVYSRVIPYYEGTILPYIKNNKNIIIASSGNALRALVKYLENIPDDKIAEVEIATGEILVYELDSSGKVLNKDKRASNPNKV